ncbi:MAG: SAM-dependent methyltransferase, partial [Burkholderiales bacterium]|nr:SAM-dependent methyltransferase [Burkholderiales bacterium]
MIPASIDLVPSPEALAHSQRLVGRIGVAIDAGGGWLPFDRFMAMALYEPGLGYYTGGSTKFGAAGDFVTAPELSPLFGRTLAREIAAVLRQTGGDVLELGPGTGRLALQILTALDALDCLPDRYRLLDVSGELRERQSRLLWDGVPHLASRIEWLDALPETLRGVVLGNEVLDAIPVHLIAWRD